MTKTRYKTLILMSALMAGVTFSYLPQAHALDSFAGSYAGMELHSKKIVPVTENAAMDGKEANAATQGAQSFIDNMGKRAIGFLADTSLSKQQKAAEFRKLLRDSFDMKTIGRFSLGTYWNAATETEKAEYQALFEDMIVEVYSGRFDDYKGQSLDVRSARVDGKDTLVNSFIVDKSGQEFKIDWRVRNKDGKYKIVDVIIEGVSMSLTQRSDFSSVIQRGGGKVQVLLAHLKAN